MRPFELHTVISAPREAVFDELVDLSGRVAWADHYMEEYRLARANPRGLGAAARFRIKPPLVPHTWVEIQIAEADRPRRIVEEGRYGRVGRSRLRAVYELVQEGPGVTRVILTMWTEPGHRWDAIKEAFGTRRWLRRQLKVALGRLRAVFEEPPAAPLARATVAAYEPMKHARFGA